MLRYRRRRAGALPAFKGPSVYRSAAARSADHRHGRRDGFTLVETLVALAVFSLVAVTLLNLAGENSRSAAQLERRVLGAIVAENLAVQAFALPNPPAFGETSGEAPTAGLRLRWVQTVARTDDPGMVRIEIRVLDRANQIAWLTVFRDTGA
jgi:general secretion pathway protein I